jgi:hypothetical protein
MLRHSQPLLGICRYEQSESGKAMKPDSPRLRADAFVGGYQREATADLDRIVKSYSFIGP